MFRIGEDASQAADRVRQPGVLDGSLAHLDVHALPVTGAPLIERVSVEYKVDVAASVHDATRSRISVLASIRMRGMALLDVCSAIVSL